jgi:hypothetical protein
MNELTNESGDIDTNLYAEWWYPYYIHWIIKIWRAIFDQIMFNIDDWKFKYKQAEWMWTNLKNFFSHYYGEGIVGESVFRFFLKKLRIWFFEYDLSEENKQKIIKYWLWFGDGKSLKDVYEEEFEKKSNYLPWIVSDTLEEIDKYMKFLTTSLVNLKGQKQIKDIISQEIWVKVTNLNLIRTTKQQNEQSEQTQKVFRAA